ncbi:glycosyl hydrolase family 8 [Roseomonas sp. NAR14]|uniref:cellulase n=1 Tax=Roseomonas acroporae TaxID=2937791 RepID=A0A9X1Y900_9PROT|nr:glycosyl hydrolase family 8 [Roseomonas acroporae]MCK8784322.1 glycosyl hydrolase family 8 [Roseomonas acroporae]
MPTRRHLLRAAALLPLPAGPLQAGERRADPDEGRADWHRFRDRFLAPEGRIVDTGNGGISHSEGQGLGLLLAAHGDDREGFDRIREWTRRTLRLPSGLHAWRFRPGAANPVSDRNNATDGDLYIAWGLLTGARRWRRAEAQAEAVATAQAVLRLNVRRAGRLAVLLPGRQGFERGGTLVVNPSYYVFPALRALAGAAPDPGWLTLTADGLTLLRRARFGRWGLPPDWLALAPDGTVRPAEGWPARFSYDAVRVPLFLTWAGLRQEPPAIAAAAFWQAMPQAAPPAWASLTDDSISHYSATPGIMAVSRLVRAQMEQVETALQLPPVSIQEDYYSASLTCLARLARREGSTGQPVP